MAGYSDVANGSITAQSMAGFFARSKSAELDYKSRAVLVSRARILNMSSTIARAVHDVLLRGVIGSGLKIQNTPDIFNNDWDAVCVLKKLDYLEQLDFVQLQQQVFSTMLISGEAFLIRVKDAFSLYSSWVVREPDHVANPPFLTIVDGCYYNKSHRVVDGIEYNAQNKPTYIWYIENPYTTNLSNRKNWSRIPIVDKDGLPNVLHVRKLDRADYPRGIPVLSPVIDLIWSTLAFTESEVQMGILQSCSAYAIKTETNKSLNPFSALSNADLDAPLTPSVNSDNIKPSNDFSIIQPPNRTSIDGMFDTTDYIKPGCSHHLAPNESIEFLQPTAPTTNLTAFYDLVTQQVGAALGIPKQVLNGSYEASYSAAKASFAQFEHTCSIYRKFIIETFLKPIIRVFAYELITHSLRAKEAIKEAVNYTVDNDIVIATMFAVNSEWATTDKPLLLDPTKEIDFYTKALELNLIDKERVAQTLFGTSAIENLQQNNTDTENASTDNSGVDNTSIDTFNTNDSGTGISDLNIYELVKAVEAGLITQDDAHRLVMQKFQSMISNE